MEDVGTVITAIHTGFARTPHPGGPFLQGSFDGCEPEEEVAPFRTIEDWRSVPASLLDGHYSALSFFSEGGFRFFIPAYMVADLRDELQTADPVFHLTHGFGVLDFTTTSGERVIRHRSGGQTLLNPRRYGAITWEDYARYRLSVFAREEAAAIVSYLRYRRETDTLGTARDPVARALDRFWLERAASAPTVGMLEEHLAR